MCNLAKALEIAYQIHKDDYRWDKKTPYIFHPLRICFKMKTDSEKIVALLHDAIEDHPDKLNFGMLEELGFSDEVIQALKCLTHYKGDNYEDYINYLSYNGIARRVKIADLEDNMRLDEIEFVSEKHRERLNKYLKAYKLLKGIEEGV